MKLQLSFAIQLGIGALIDDPHTVRNVVSVSVRNDTRDKNVKITNFYQFFCKI